ncbi:subtilisin-like serine protease [Methanomethylovorans hollandica DSM 15978]|uniref:Subtilisin-like serine protease n=1 Tax=Methanomethylovorans hollandica (strain DSM 15978 / NBRC 107637 / DMS1) TaxID=867904 RepID=L0KUP5_METHD|nr:PGF-pre-PGF domain-containing protein [Methanomethylovorans hollandica]AGB48831.1 subtilisin-like serine protease [Methanomethylovorans hollandica DSM 15978]
MHCKKQIQQLVSFATVLLFSGIVIFGSLSIAIGDINSSNASQAGGMTIVDISNITKEQEKMSSDLISLVTDQGELSSEATAYTNSAVSSPVQVNDEQERQLVFVYISLFQGEQTSIIDTYAWNITSIDADNSLVTAWVDVNRLEEIASLEEVRSVRTVVRPMVNTGAVKTAGDAIHRTDLVRSGYSKDGSGIKIGVISDGVNAISASQASGDLPSDVTVLRNNVGGDEGIAMMEIIHDMAPGAKLYFHDHGNSVYEFNDAIDSLVEAGCTIIVDDITWPDQPFFEDGVVATHVAEVIANNNIVYISSAGNSAMRHYQGMFVDDGTGYHDKVFPLPAGASFQLFLQWDDQFGLSSNDYDLYVLDSSGSTIAYSSNSQSGNGDPLEWTSTSYLSEPAYIKIKSRDGTAERRTLELFIYPSSQVTLDQTNLTSLDSIFGHPAVPDVIAVAAISGNNVDHDRVESYSSQGPVTIAYPVSAAREKPDLAGISSVAVTGAGNFGTIFSGTSAAAPHVAAVAAQLWGNDMNMSAAEVRNILYQTAEDVESSGSDYLSGHGRVDALNCFAYYVNRAPVLENTGNREINETQELVINLIATDMDGEALTYSTDAPFGTLVGNVFSWTPTYEDAGTYTVEFSVTDGKHTDSKLTTITVNNVDRAPVIETIGNKQINENSLLEFTILANDPDGDAVTYSVDDLPPGATFNVSTRTFSWISSPDIVGHYQVIFSAEANGLSDSETITITVGDLAGAPELGATGNRNINENDLLEFIVSASDPEGDIIIYSATDLPDGATFDINTGAFSWTPDYNDSGTYTVVFVAEAGGLLDSETIVITVNNVDREPELSPIGNKEVNESELLSFTISATDHDMDTISYLATNLPYGADLNNVTGEFSWAPTYSDSGVYDVEFIANANGLITSENVLITVNNVDRAPVFVPIGDQVADENRLLSFNISATDEDGDIVRYSAVSLPEGAELNSETGDFNWIPVATGNYVVTFIAESNGLNDSQNITIEVLDSPPFISDLSVSSITSSSITLTWTNSPDVAFTEIYRNNTIIGNVTGPSSQYEDLDLTSNTSYEYSLLPYAANGVEGSMVSITLVTSSPSSSNSGSGGSGRSSSSGTSAKSSGGGGGAGSSEDFVNIAVKDVATAYVMMDSDITYEFTREGNAVQSISFHSLKNSGEITSAIEVLKGRSKLVSSDAEGIVYKYINIWVGKSGFATPSNMNDIRINFKVNNSWIQEMGLAPEEVILQRYNGSSWEVLPTTLQSDTIEYSIFESTTPGFSAFAITGEKSMPSPVSSSEDIGSDQIENAGLTQSQPERSNIWSILMAILAISFVVVGYTYLKKRQN